MKDNTYDAIVVGSGISGGWAAKELTQKGLKTLLLERGRNITHVKDYVNATKHPWEYPYRGTVSQQMHADYPVLRRDYVLNEKNLDFWVDEKDNPYVEIKRFDWYRGYQVGGRSLMWARHCYRLSDIDFEANLKEGIGADWPIRYADIAPWYSYVEKWAGISGNRDGIPILPDGEYLPPMEMNIVEKDLARRIKRHYQGARQLIMGRKANLTVPHQGRINCQYQNQCWLGCNFGAYFSTQSATLPPAMATGNLTLRPFSIVMHILYDRDLKRAVGVEVLDAETNLTYRYYARVIFLCASALNSAWILMNSARDVWKDGLGSSSGQLGHNVMDHHFRCGAKGRVEGYEDRYYFGRRPNSVYIPRFRNLGGEKREYVRGFGYQGSATRKPWRGEINGMSIGGSWKDAICEPGDWSVEFNGFGEILPNHSNRVFLHDTQKDKWGLPVLAMDCAIGDNERAMRKDMMEDCKEMLEIAGVKDVRAFDYGYGFGQGIHEMGSARMGRDPRTSVLNGNNQVWDAKNVFVTDGACMASAGCVNPSLTYMALTARASHFAADAMRKGVL